MSDTFNHEFDAYSSNHDGGSSYNYPINKYKLTAYYKLKEFEEEILEIDYKTKTIYTANDSGSSCDKFYNCIVFADIYCCTCNKEVHAKQVSGKLIYSHREDLYHKFFYQCPHCGEYVGTHKSDTFAPLGIIPNKKIREARRYIHKYLDPIWQQLGVNRSELYDFLKQKLGYEYHTAEIKDVNVAREIFVIVKELHDCLMSHAPGYIRNAT